MAFAALHEDILDSMVTIEIFGYHGEDGNVVDAQITMAAIKILCLLLQPWKYFGFHGNKGDTLSFYGTQESTYGTYELEIPGSL